MLQRLLLAEEVALRAAHGDPARPEEFLAAGTWEESARVATDRLGLYEVVDTSAAAAAALALAAALAHLLAEEVALRAAHGDPARTEEFLAAGTSWEESARVAADRLGWCQVVDTSAAAAALALAVALAPQLAGALLAAVMVPEPQDADPVPVHVPAAAAAAAAAAVAAGAAEDDTASSNQAGVPRCCKLQCCRSQQRHQAGLRRHHAAVRIPPVPQLASLSLQYVQLLVLGALVRPTTVSVLCATPTGLGQWALAVANANAFLVQLSHVAKDC